MQRMLVLACAVLGVAIAGCKPAPSPLETFKSLVDQKTQEIKAKCPAIPLGNVSFDVQKTDSLASPFVGNMSFSTLNRQFGNNGLVIESDANLELQYALQEGVWAFKGGKLKQSNPKLVRDSSDRLGADIVARMKRDQSSDAIGSETLLFGLLEEFNKNLSPKK